MKKRYKLESGFDAAITLEIDTEKLSQEMAAEVNGFWMGAKEVLDAANGDIYEAVARWAAGRLLRYLIDGYNQQGAVRELSEQEGWPPFDELGMTIIDYEFPELEASEFQVTAIAI